jgi:mono/diheme cytochrome c family protein
MKVVIRIVLFTLLVTAFYTYVGQMVPQKEVHPPKDLEVGAGLSTAELVQAGRQIAEGKGTCMGCHTIGASGKQRFPDLAGIGSKAATRRPGVSDVDYLAEALYEPDAYIVEGYSPGMPPIAKPPISLSDAEILAVIAYLQSLGGTASVTTATRVKYATTAPAAAAAAGKGAASASPPGGTAAAGAAPATTAAASPATPEQLLERHGCYMCHGRDKGAKTLGPSFHGMGRRLTAPQIYEAILDPDASIAKGYPKGAMSSNLKATGFYEKATAADIRAMAEYLARGAKP